MGEETQVVGVRFPVSKIEEIEAHADAEGLSKSEFIRNAVYRELGEELLLDRIDLLEEAVLFLLEDTAPPGEIEFVNSKQKALIDRIQSK